LDDLGAFPVLEKRDIQEHRERLVADGWPRADLIPYETGGSTGCPLSFYLCGEPKRARGAAAGRPHRWAGWDVGDRVAILWGAPRDRPPAGWRPWLRRALLDPQLFLDAGHLTEARLAAFHEELIRFRPAFLQAYAQAAALLARYLKATG